MGKNKCNLRELADQAEEGLAKAVNQLEEIAESHGIDLLQYDTWGEIVDAIEELTHPANEPQPKGSSSLDNLLNALTELVKAVTKKVGEKK